MVSEFKKNLKQHIKDAKKEVQRLEREVKACWRAGAWNIDEFNTRIEMLLRAQEALTAADAELGTLEDTLLNYEQEETK